MGGERDTGREKDGERERGLWVVGMRRSWTSTWINTELQSSRRGYRKHNVKTIFRNAK